MKLPKLVTAKKGGHGPSVLFPCTGEIIQKDKKGKKTIVLIKPIMGGPLLQTEKKYCHKPKLPHNKMKPSEAWARYLACGGKFSGDIQIAKENFVSGFKAGKRKNPQQD